MSVAEINAIKDAILEILVAVVFLGVCVLCWLASMGAFDKDN